MGTASVYPCNFTQRILKLNLFVLYLSHVSSFKFLTDFFSDLINLHIFFLGNSAMQKKQLHSTS